MTPNPRNRFCAALILLVSLTRLAAGQSPPVARVVPKIDTLHGEIREDDYFWLRNKQNPDVRAYLEAENAYTTAEMKHTEALQEQLYRELLGRIKETDLSVPYRDHGFWYYTRTEQGKSYPIYCRRQGTLDAPEEVILDVNQLAQGKKFMSVGGMRVSPDGNRWYQLTNYPGPTDGSLFGVLAPLATDHTWRSGTQKGKQCHWVPN